ncbi:MAG: heavy metal translocating P-type ATPase [Gemmatimonadota bacterium]
MKSRQARIEVAVLLPEVVDTRDGCVKRLEGLIGESRGIERAHVVEESDGRAELCLHYDPALVTLAQVERLARAAGAELEERFGHVLMRLGAGLSEDAGRRIEATLGAVDGVLEASANVAARRVRIEFDRVRTTEDALRASLEGAGYGRPTRSSSEEDADADASWYARNRELVWSLGSGILLVAAWVGERWLGLGPIVAVGLYLGAYALGGFDLVHHWVSSLRRGRISFDIDLLMLLAAIGAAILGEWAEGAFLLFLFSLAHALQHYALGRARRAIKALAELAPATATVLRDGNAEEVAIEDVSKGDVVLVRPAERVPVDGTVREGFSAVNQAPITGESVPVEKAPGDEVFAGSVNGDGSLEVVTTGTVGDRTLDRVIRLVEEAQTQKAPTQQFTDRFESIFVPVVLVADLLLIFVPPLMGWWIWADSFYRGMALLVASSPCALALGTPAAVLTGIAQAARNGVLIKGGAHLENLGSVRALAMDKTGTLTKGTPEVTDVVPAGDATTEDLLRFAAAVEVQSQHPLAAAVVRRAERDDLDVPEAGPLESLTARGVRADVEGETVTIGNLRLWEDEGIAVPEEIRRSVAKLQEGGKSVMAVQRGSRWLGTLGLADEARPAARDMIRRLHGLGIKQIVMLTGDNELVARAIADEVGLDEVRAALLPEEKLDEIRTLIERHGSVAMVGDGVNDAPALAHATIGIAMGGMGTAVALETADVALMADDLEKLPFAIGLSRASRAIIRQNFGISLGVIVLLVVATVTGWAGIGFAVLVHEGSTLVVVGNALRLLKFRP